MTTPATGHDGGTAPGTGIPDPGTPDPAAAASAYRRARRRLGRWRRRVVDPDNLKERHQKLKARVDQQGKQGTEVRTQVRQLRAALGSLTKRVDVVEFASDHREREHRNLTIQVGHCEQRLGAIEQRLIGEHFTVEDGDEAEARRLVDEIRREHQQIRVRMQIVGQYEDRLRRLEAEIADLSRQLRSDQG